MLGLVAIAGLTSYLNYSNELTSKHVQLDELSSRLETYQADLSTKQSLLDSTKTQLASLQQHADSFNKLSNDKILIGKKTAELDETRKQLLKDFLEMVMKVRANAEGMELATMTLSSGQVLQGVKLQKITDTTVSISHSNGLIKIEGKDLPDDLRERFRYGMEPTVSDVPPPILPSSSTPTSSSPPKSTVPATHYQIEIEAIDQKIAQLDKSKMEWASLANSYRSQVSSAQFAGRPSYTSRNQAAQADQTVQTINAQISKLQEEQVALRKKMASAMAEP